MKQTSHWFYNFLIDKGLSSTIASYINLVVLCILLIIALLIVDFFSRKILRKVSNSIAVASKTKLDDLFI
ncbi:MAG: miniconductance mechanosensitive channel, partial [Dokdonia sp.]